MDFYPGFGRLLRSLAGDHRSDRRAQRWQEHVQREAVAFDQHAVAVALTDVVAQSRDPPASVRRLRCRLSRTAVPSATPHRPTPRPAGDVYVAAGRSWRRCPTCRRRGSAGGGRGLWRGTRAARRRRSLPARESRRCARTDALGAQAFEVDRRPCAAAAIRQALVSDGHEPFHAHAARADRGDAISAPAPPRARRCSSRRSW